MLPTPSRPFARAVLRALPGRLGRALRVARESRHYAPPLQTTLRQLFPRLRLLAWPERPSPSQILFKLCAVNGYELLHDPNAKYDLALHFAKGGACSLPTPPPTLNRGCENIGKSHVARVFAEVFGYGLLVDPTRYAGPILCKSDVNYTHDGVILEGPLKASQVAPGRVYQRFIESEDSRSAIDLRTPLYGGFAPLVYLKRRPLGPGRFAEVESATVLEPREVFSAGELELLARFAALMRLDFGEADVLRDRRDGRIYVVDVANQPSGPPKALPPAETRAAVGRLASAFGELVSLALAGRTTV